MSDTIYKIIPENYNFFPSGTRCIDEAVKLLKGNIHSDSISWTSFENPTFIDCGNCFDSVSCPFCGKEISDDVWQEMMNQCFESSRFNDIEVSVDCCNRETSLNDLNYNMDCGFAKFAINILNPVKPPCEHDLREVGTCLGNIRLKIIVSRY